MSAFFKDFSLKHELIKCICKSVSWNEWECKIFIKTELVSGYCWAMAPQWCPDDLHMFVRPCIQMNAWPSANPNLTDSLWFSQVKRAWEAWKELICGHLPLTLSSSWEFVMRQFLVLSLFLLGCGTLGTDQQDVGIMNSISNLELAL